MHYGKLAFGITLIMTGLLSLTGCDVLSPSDPASLKASGVVEIMEISVAAEIGGKVSEVFVEEGAVVAVGEPLFSIDDEELQLQREQVIVSGEAAVVGADLALLTARQAIDELQENWPIQAAQYQLELALAMDALKKAENRLMWQQKNNRATDDTIEYYEAQLVLAREQAADARAIFDRYKDEPEYDPQRAAARVALEEADNYVDKIVSTLNWYGGEPTDIDQALLDANVAVARASVDEAAQEYDKWKDGPDPDALALAQANIANAEVLLKLAEVQAESHLRTIDIGLEDALIRAPIDGVILTHSVEQGEVITPGVAVITLGNTDRMTITVYLAENQYGQISVGDRASVEVDSFAGVSFEAEVVRIADEAEYTPRNVQTEEERQTTVYAIELRVLDPDGKLKPGMPADVVFTVAE